MTETYKAGEHVRIIKSDPIFKSELGDQTGLVGKIKEVSDSGNVYVKFPHVDEKFYYLNSEVEPAVKKATPSPEPVKDYLFRKGDTVRYRGSNRYWTGSEFTVDNDVEKRLYGSHTIRLTATAVSEKLKGQGYKVGSSVGLDTSTVEKFTPTPEPKFKVGDWVKVTGYSPAGTTWEGFVGEVTSISHVPYEVFIIDNHKGKGYSSGGFEAKYLVAAEKPYEPKFKVGDWVEVTGCCTGSNSKYKCNGSKVQIKTVPTEESNRMYKVTRTDGGLYTDYNEEYLKLTEKPFVPKFKIGDFVKVNYPGFWLDEVGKVAALPNSEHDSYKVSHSKEARNGYFIEHELTLTTEPKPEPKFKRGDWVVVHGRGDSWDGRKATINADAIDNGGFWKVLLDGQSGNYAHFQESKLKATTKPWAPSFKVGDWVEISGWTTQMDGEKLQVRKVPLSKSEFYRFAGKDNNYGFSERYLKLAEAPHWTEAEVVGRAARIGTRTVVKVEADKWLFVYDTSSNYPSTAYRNNFETKNLFKLETPTFVTTL